MSSSLGDVRDDDDDDEDEEKDEGEEEEIGITKLLVLKLRYPVIFNSSVFDVHNLLSFPSRQYY